MIRELKRSFLADIEKVLHQLNNGYNVNLDPIVDRIYYINSLIFCGNSSEIAIVEPVICPPFTEAPILTNCNYVSALANFVRYGGNTNPTIQPTIFPTLFPTVTPTTLPTVTPTITITPTVTPTITPTITLPPTIAPTIPGGTTLTPTVSPTTITPTITIPPTTISPTITPTTVGVYTHDTYGSAGTLDMGLACSLLNTPIGTYYTYASQGATLVPGIQFYTTNTAGVLSNPTTAIANSTTIVVWRQITKTAIQILGPGTTVTNVQTC